MYFVDRQKIRDTCIYLENLLQTFDKEKTFDTHFDQLSLERTVHILIESILDVGNMMIDGFVMRDPGSYEDIINILVDERVIPERQADHYKQLIQLRKMVVVDYLAVDHEKLFHTLAQTKDTIIEFPAHVLTYLNDELDVPHAFINE